MNEGRRRAALALLATVTTEAVCAHPDAPPWGPPAAEPCAECHFGAPVVESSEALEFDGLPARIAAGQTYRLEIRFAPQTLQRAGFLIVAQMAGGPAGAFEVIDDRVETSGERARSTLAGTRLTGPARTRWRVDWQAPCQLTGPITFTVTANAANDDESPLGDVIHQAEFLQP